MRGKMAGGLLGLVLCGGVLGTVGFAHLHEEKHLYIVVGSADVVIPGAEGKATTQTEIMVDINAAASSAAAMHRLNEQLQQKFTPAKGYKNHRIIAVRKVRTELLEEVLATKHKPHPQLPLKPYLYF
jgi:hypothetical protein